MSPTPGGWVDELEGDLAADGGVAYETYGLLALLLGLGLILAQVHRLAEVIAEPPAPEVSADARLAHEIQVALDLKAAGRYREAWVALRKLHDAAPREPKVNFELARYHHEVGNPDFASEYLLLVEARDPDPPKVRLLRAALAAGLAADLHRRATRPGTRRARTLALLEEAAAARRVGLARLPEKDSPGAPAPVRRRVRAELARAGHLIALKKAIAGLGGPPAERAAATAALADLAAKAGLPADVKQRAAAALKRAAPPPPTFGTAP